MQIICILLQTDNNTSISPLRFLQLPFLPPNQQHQRKPLQQHYIMAENHCHKCKTHTTNCSSSSPKKIATTTRRWTSRQSVLQQVLDLLMPKQRLLHFAGKSQSCLLDHLYYRTRAGQGSHHVGPMPNVMAALPNIGGALSSMLQSLADTYY